MPDITHKPIWCEPKGQPAHLVKAKFMMWTLIRGVKGSDTIKVMTHKGETTTTASEYCDFLTEEAKDQWLAM